MSFSLSHFLCYSEPVMWRLVPWEHCIPFDFPGDKNSPIPEREPTTDQKKYDSTQG